MNSWGLLSSRGISRRIGCLCDGRAPKRFGQCCFVLAQTCSRWWQWDSVWSAQVTVAEVFLAILTRYRSSSCPSDPRLETNQLLQCFKVLPCTFGLRGAVLAVVPTLAAFWVSCRMVLSVSWGHKCHPVQGTEVLCSGFFRCCWFFFVVGLCFFPSFQIRKKLLWFR